MRNLWEYLTRFYDRHPRWGAALAGSLVLIGLTGIHGLVEFASAARVLYVLPIWLATRMGGKVSGLILVVLSTLAGTLTEAYLGVAPNESLPANLIVRFGSLLILMLLIAQVERALQKHQQMALTDPLTGLLNRHALKEFAQQAFHRALVREQPMTVVVIDCDGFKALNDTFGHKAGDHVLMLLARALESQTRQTDLVARIGGDEFAVVFQDTDVDEARQIMNRVDYSFTDAARNAGYEAGLSIGFGVMGETCHELDAVLEIADRSMYEHKHQKRTAAFLN